MKKANTSTNKKKYNDVIDRMRKAHHQNKDKMNDDEPERSDSASRQRKLDDLKNRSGGNGKKVSWAGLREKLFNAIQKEEYRYEVKENPFGTLSYEEVCDIADEMTEDEIVELGFDDEEDFWDYINQAFQLDEA
jgi:TFIIF-interacting CTD phosphatase-like protein